jgi:hypothetical protein
MTTDIKSTNNKDIDPAKSYERKVSLNLAIYSRFATKNNSVK